MRQRGRSSHPNRRRSRPKKGRAQAPHRVAVQVHGPRPRSTSIPRCGCWTCPGSSGNDPESGDDITAQNGRYGPYLKKGVDTRSLTEEDQIFEIDLAGALELYAQPKYGARRASSALKEFDADPESGKPIKVKDGRFGPYVTDGVTNATIPRGETVEEVDFDRAVQLLADKRAKGPAKPKKAPAKRKPAAKKPAAKKSTATAAKKSTATAAKKTTATAAKKSTATVAKKSTAAPAKNSTPKKETA